MLKVILSKTERSLSDIQASLAVKERQWNLKIREFTAAQAETVRFRQQLELALELATGRQDALQTCLSETEARKVEALGRAEAAESRTHELQLLLAAHRWLSRGGRATTI